MQMKLNEIKATDRCLEKPTDENEPQGSLVSLQ